MKKFVIVKANDPLRFVTADLDLHPEYKKAWKLSREHGENILQALQKSNALNDPGSLLILTKAETFYNGARRKFRSRSGYETSSST